MACRVKAYVDLSIGLSHRNARSLNIYDLDLYHIDSIIWSMFVENI